MAQESEWRTTPCYVRDTLVRALSGDICRQQLPFQAMIDIWPRLLKKLLGHLFACIKKTGSAVN